MLAMLVVADAAAAVVMALLISISLNTKQQETNITNN